MGLALFTLSGTQIGEAAGLAPVIVVLMGTMTGAAGGVMRDILCAEVPLILRRDLYASAAIGGSSLYLVLKAMDVASSWAFGIGMAAVFMLRLLAMAWGISLPVFHLPRRRA
jgi:uncharacterized membrane protein YeiH